MTTLPEWLTFISTMVLGAVTVYFACRTRQLERKQARQINREFDRELADAEAELQKGAAFRFYWENWKKGRTPMYALDIYAQARANMPLPDLPKIDRTLTFHLPGTAVKHADSGSIKLQVAKTLLDTLLTGAQGMPQPDLDNQLRSAEDLMQEAESEMGQALEAVKQQRAILRQTI
jgi:hypothetical protein